MASEIDEFELFRARSYGVESELRHQRASSVRVSKHQQHLRGAGNVIRERRSEKGHVHRRPLEVPSAEQPSSNDQASMSPVTSGADEPPDPSEPSPVSAPTPKLMTAAERKASFKKSSSKRRVIDTTPPEIEINNIELFPVGSDSGGESTITHPVVSRRSSNDDVTRRKQDGGGVMGVAGGGEEEQCRVYRMRSFYTRSGNVVNRGDSMRVHSAASASRLANKTRNSQAVPPRLAVVVDTSLCDEDEENCATSTTAAAATDNQLLTTPGGGARQPQSLSDERDKRRQKLIAAGGASSESTGATGSIGATSYRVLVIGSSGVGKTTLTQQILTSEYLANMESFTG